MSAPIISGSRRAWPARLAEGRCEASTTVAVPAKAGSQKPSCSVACPGSPLSRGRRDSTVPGHRNRRLARVIAIRRAGGTPAHASLRRRSGGAADALLAFLLAALMRRRGLGGLFARLAGTSAGRPGQLRGAGRDGRGDGCCQESQGKGSSERFHTCCSLGLSAEPKAPLAATSTTAPRPLHLSRQRQIATHG